MFSINYSFLICIIELEAVDDILRSYCLSISSETFCTVCYADKELTQELIVNIDRCSEDNVDLETRFSF